MYFDVGAAVSVTDEPARHSVAEAETVIPSDAICVSVGAYVAIPLEAVQ